MSSFAQRFPVSAFPDQDVCDAATAARWVGIFFWIGLAARAVRYLLCFPLWEDESFLGVNFIDRGYAELMRPLDFHQVAPLLFLWIQRLFVDLFGFNEYALRLFAFISGIASLILFRRLATQLLSGTALVLAFAVFAVSYPCIRYSAVAKPYGSDLLVSLILTTLVVEWLRDPQRIRRLWALTAFAPLAVGTSYPAAFVGGGVSLFVAHELCLRPNRPALVAWIGYNLALVGGFIGFYLLTTAAQLSAEHSFMDGCWNAAFPPLAEPWKLPQWLLATHTGELLAYPFGGARGLSTVTFLTVVVATIAVVRRRRWDLLWFGVPPLALNLFAAALERYPYGGHVKLVHYAAGWICLASGFGAATLVQLAARQPAWQPFLLRACIGLQLAVAAIGMGRDFASPYKTQSDQRQRDFARWFWFSYPAAGELQLAEFETDPTVGGVPCAGLCWRATYLCNRAIYAPRRHAKPSTDDHLRCVAYRDLSLFPADPEVERRWLARMEEDHRLVRRDRFPLPYFYRDNPALAMPDVVEVFEFEPQTKLQTATSGAAEVRR